MVDQKTLKKLADKPLAKHGVDTINMSAPVLVEMNAEGKWESTKPENLDDKKLRAVVNSIINSKAAIAAQDYCSQCAAKSKNAGGSKRNSYVPVIVMPVFPADQCPFDMNCEVQKMHDKKILKKISSKKTPETTDDEDDDDEDKVKQPKKRVFVLQRLTDFDLLSQW